MSREVSQPMSMCRGCGERNSSGKSHIIPKSFFRHMDDGVSPLVEISTRQGFYPKRRRVGYYDKTILCDECERVFGKYDDFGHGVLVRRIAEQSEICDGNDVRAYRLNDVDGDKFKRFIVSVLWRASVSTLPQYSMVRLGAHEARAKAICWGDSFLSTDEFTFIGTRYKHSEVSEILLNPHRLRNRGINFISLYFPGYSFWVKVDQRQMPATLDKFNIAKIGTLMLLAQDMKETREYDVIREALRVTSIPR